jgi:hypothetical protein
MLGSLKTTSFKEVYKGTRLWPHWIRFLVLGLLVWVEERWIATHVEETVDEAIKEYETLQTDPMGVPKPIYSETGSDFFDEMRLTAPWKAREGTSDSPQV